MTGTPSTTDRHPESPSRPFPPNVEYPVPRDPTGPVKMGSSAPWFGCPFVCVFLGDETDEMPATRDPNGGVR